MILTAWAIFRASLPLQLVALALAAWAGNTIVQRQKGEDRAYAKIEKKADANAEIANDVRTNVDAGKRGKPDPHLRRMQ